MRIPPPRLLPLTIVALAALLGVKSIALVQAATEAPAALASASQSMLPEAQAASVATPGPPQPTPSQPVAVAGPMLAPSTPPPSPISPAEQTLLQELRARNDALDARARTLDERQAVLDAAEHKLSEQTVQLAALQKRLETLDSERKAHIDANWDGLVKTYEAMRPRDAAAIFDDLDMATLLPVLDRMEDRKAAPVLAAMRPERARLATQMLAQRRLQETAVPAPGAS